MFLSLLERHHDGAMTSAGLVLGVGTNPTTRSTARDVLLSSATQLATVSGLADAAHRDEPTADEATVDEHDDEHP